jgi:hypothetical protein
MAEPSEKHGSQSRVQRWVTAAFGALFVGIAVAILYFSGSEHRFGAYAAALVVGGLGVDALLSATRNRRSMLSRIGPLP